MRSTVAPDKQDHKTKFQDYYDFRESVATIPSHRLLAILRGVREELLSMGIEIDTAKALALVQSHVIRQPDTLFVPYLLTVCEDAYQRLLFPSLQNEVRRAVERTGRCGGHYGLPEQFAQSAPGATAGSYRVLGIDPGLRTGCKLAVVDKTGKFLEYATIYPLVPRQDVAGAEQVLQDLVSRYAIKAIAVGNGTGSRETEAFVRQFLKKTTAGLPLSRGQ